ncbi:C-mannosyltransferase dpy-19 homolog [Musca vetustissima]|uniref:C-mannosyltransferase dpy-19 homolog n=1 Tax=Musca vetustissima TaxID=27455 RepID=UPI002AB71A06|nr:C-mannosyltransferase dpy-19 homolog [Musca vetustissima]
MREPKLILMLAQSLIGTGFFFLYVHHVRNIFENRTNMAHLTQLERESLFRREDALYHSFYKTLTEAPDFWSGCWELMNVTSIEYPNSINVLSRFHVLPEITIGFLYHLLRSHSRLGILSLLSCWRSDDIRLTLEHGRCEGQALQFYFECVWLLGGLTVLIIYMYGLLLSRNLFGGIYAVVSYIMFHSFAAKIYERPMARENFAFPAIYVQMFYLCICINRVTERRKYRMSVLTSLKLVYLTTVALLCWQYSAIIFASQILILMLPWSISGVPNRVVGLFTMDYVISQLSSNFLAYYYSFGNRRYLFGWQLGPLVGLSLITAMRLLKKPTASTANQEKEHELSVITENTAEFLFKTIPLGILISICSQGTIIDILEMSGAAKPSENTFALYRDLFIHWVLQAKVNFVTSLSACNPEYERMQWSELWGFIKNLIVKPYCLYGVVIMARFFRKWRKSTEVKEPNTDVIERAKKYILEDFLEENHVSMQDMSKKETEAMLNDCLDLLAKCDYDYERYKKEKTNSKKDKPNEHMDFLNDIKKLKEQIHEQREHKVEAEEKLKNDSEEKEKEGETETETAKRQKESSENDNMDNGNNITSPNTTNNQDTKNSQKQNEAETETTEKPSVNGKNQTSSNAPVNDSTTKSKSTKRQHHHSKHDLSNADDDYDGADDDENTCNYRSFHYLYSFLQMTVFTVMGLSIKKLFFLCFTQGCVLGSTICSSFMSNKNRRIFWTAYLLVFLTSIVNPGIKNIQEEYFPSSNVKLINDDLDTMLEWIKMNTEKDAVFAGPIEIIGTVHLSTRRPIVNHAHLEMKQISDRTEHVYSIFSRQQSSDIYNQCSQLKIQYLIITVKDCENHISDECDLLSIWDDMQPAYRKYPQFCSELAVKNIPSFLKVFTNDYYAIIKMFSQSVQINLKYNKMPEKQM